MILINKKNLKLWFTSVACMALSVIPFVLFMFNLRLSFLYVALAAIGAATAFYLVMTKRITHPKHGYTALQAIEFFKKCLAAGFADKKVCSEKKSELLDFAKDFDFAKNLDFYSLLELYKTGQDLLKK